MQRDALVPSHGSLRKARPRERRRSGRMRGDGESWRSPWEQWKRLCWRDRLMTQRDWHSLLHHIINIIPWPQMGDLFTMPGSKERTAKTCARCDGAVPATHLAVITGQTIIWRPQADDMLIQMCGGRKIVVEWLRRGWATERNGHVEECDTQAPSIRYDYLKHISREGNAYADELTWHARESRGSIATADIIHHRANIKCIGGCWDGGVSESGSAGGFWFEV
eukprot:1435651-Pyramimonas_sp.AAC.1